MESVLKDFMKRNKMIIAYSRDVFGFKNGVVVALGLDRIGWSMVNNTADIKYKRMKPHQIPSIQRMVRVVEDSSGGTYTVPDAEAILNSKAYKKLINAHGDIRVPEFNRELGLIHAIDRALNNVVVVSDGGEGMYGDVPSDENMVNLLFRMIVRSRRSIMFNKGDTIEA
jgi:hypothetical protein